MTYKCFDDKRVVLEDNIHTYAHGNYKIQEIEELERIEVELVAMMDDTGYLYYNNYFFLLIDKYIVNIKCFLVSIYLGSTDTLNFNFSSL
ncbi:Uncharacterized protein FWK35_00019535 [Aphis craccivora]|uniref:Uncharacterized protein n=1 Tax=Aphis craccivora TaxID=307492 RepID=A0A6G0XUV6_APHCR|nr:Uncharacterized protein FWK35_00019535 [Aphis craccivora]